MKRLGFALFVLASVLVVACGDDKPPAKADGGAASATAKRAPTAAPATASATLGSGRPAFGADAGADGGARRLELSENDFVESDRNRDPFRSFGALFVDSTKKPTVNQRQVVLGQFSIDELKLVAIVTGGDGPRAMLMDTSNKGWVVRRGDYIGRPDTIHTGGANGADFQVNWRVERIRPGDLVLTREDPIQAGVAPATRIIPLHPEGEKDQRR